MSDSDTKFTIHISFRQVLDGLRLVIVDGNLNKITEQDTQELELSLVKGIYQLKAFFIDYFEEYFFTVTNNQNFVLDYHYPMTSPSMEFVTTHEYFSNPAETWSRKCTSNRTEENPNFFFFAASYSKDNVYKKEAMSDLLKNYSIFDDSGTIKIHFDDDNSFVDYDAVALVFSVKLKKGLYFLKYRKKQARRIFPFYIYDGYQTQFLLRYKEYPDFCNSFFYYDNKIGFNRNDVQYLLLDKIQFAYKDYNNYKFLTASDRLKIKAHPYLTALIRILHLVTENRQDAKEFDNVPILELPDIAILHSLKDDHQKINSEELPVISAIMAKCMINIGKKMEFRPGSVMDRTVDSLSFDIFWNNFSAIEDPLKMEVLYRKLLEKSKFYGIGLKDNSLVKATKLMFNAIRTTTEAVKEDRLKTLMGTLLRDTPEADTKFTDAVNSVNNASEIANKLNLPPTTVLRNYEMYDDLFKKINAK